MKISPKAKVTVAIMIVMALTGYVAGLSAFVSDVASLPQTKPAQKLDAIVVLTGGSNRLDAGFNLLEKGFGKKLFISGVYRGLDVRHLLKRWKAEPQSNLDCCVVLGFEAADTAGNAVETAEWLHKENFHSIYLVTANYHIRRALLEFARLAPDVAITPFPVIPDKLDITDWWKDPATGLLLAHEYMKYVVTYLRSLV